MSRKINTRPEDSRISQYSFAISFYEEILRQAVARPAMQYACPTWLSRINHAEAIPPMQSKIYNRRCGPHKNKSKYQTAGVVSCAAKASTENLPRSNHAADDYISDRHSISTALDYKIGGV
ncbi:hypothetical protein H105_03777 [Trichophyton soudanense CBS 452.61]|uniref:Uncharacterized protein n=1 Tax=Trichophyton soudanense CBS 452.61 TaxID=1215331 RepID=A0A022XVN9_TRISD|nr:hypothetical protein H105_03777 [Trichophyton soudanense CBS 452.61]